MERLAPGRSSPAQWRVVLLALVLFAAACTANQTEDTAQPSPGTTRVETGVSDAPRGNLTPDVPPISSLTPELAIVAPGEEVTLIGSTQLSGELRLTGPDGTSVTAPFTEGNGSVDLPTDAAQGAWQAVVASKTGAIAVGAVKVATGPSLLLISDRSNVAHAGDVTVTLYARGLPNDAQVMFGWGNLDWNAYFEDEEAGGEPLGVLIPDQHGLLQPGATPAVLSDVVGIPLLMGGGLEISGLQAMVFSPNSDDFFLSDPLRLEGCSAPVPIRGTIGGPGSVHLLSFGDGLRSAAVVTTDGSFVVEAPHGPTTLFVARDDGQPLDPIGIDVPCAGTADIDVVSGVVDILDPGIPAAVEDDEFIAGESGSLTLSGDQSTTFPVEPVCQYSGVGIDVIFATYDLDLPAVQLTIGGGEKSGSHQGVIEITDWTDVTTSTGNVAVRVDYASNTVLAEVTMNLEGAYSGAAGNGTIDGAFSCVVLGLTPPIGVSPDPEASPAPDELLVGLPPTAFDTTGPDPAISAPACRIVVVDDQISPEDGIRTAARLRAALARATVVTLSELHALFGPDPPEQPIGPGRSSGVSLTVDEGTPMVLVENKSDADELIAQVLCVDVEPVDVALGETAGLVIRATDLNGQPIAEVPVVIDESDLGTVEPSSGVLLDGVFRADFTGGSEPGEGSLTLELGGDTYPPTIAFASVATGLSYTMEGQYRVEIAPVGDGGPDLVPIPSGPLGATLVARSCSSRRGPWSGVLVLEAGPLLSMIELTGLTGGIAATLFGSEVELDEPTFSGKPTIPFPDIGLSLLVAGNEEFQGLNANPAIVSAPVKQLVEQLGANNPYKPIVLPVSFSLNPDGRASAVEVNGVSSGFSVQSRPTSGSQVRLMAEGSHLLKAFVKQAPACLTDDALARRVRDLVPEPPSLD